MGCDVRPLVILTATVTPSTSSALSLSDPNERRAQYCSAAKWWREEGDRGAFDVLLAENSGDDISAWLPPGVEGLRCAVPMTPERGKGDGEAGILRDVLGKEGKRLLERPWVAKCTGRLTVAKPSDVLPIALGSAAFVSCRPSPQFSEVDARFVVASPSVWEGHLLAFAAEIDDRSGHYLEHAFAKGVNSALLAGVEFIPFRRVPRFRGASGTSGLKYNSLKMRVAAAVEDTANAARRWGQRRM